MESIPRPSLTSGSEYNNESIHSEESKLRLKDAVVYYEQLLIENDLVTLESSPSISEEAMLIGEEIYHSTVEMLG